MKIIGLIGKIVVGIMATALLVAVILLGWFWFGDWQSRAVRDVEFVHETILAHHPGAVDPENPDFLVRMDDALARALPLARSARSPSDHRAALDAYTDVFADGHLTVATIADAPGAISRATANRDQMSGTAGVDISGNSAWITISSFNERTAPIASITQSIEARAGTLRSLDRIVFDLRGNGGGDSAFGTRIARALWTAEVYRDWVPVSAGGVDWRATADNAAHVHGIAEKHASRGRSEAAQSWTRLAERLDAAVAAGEDYARQNFRTREITRTLESPVSADVIVITDDACASSCLNFMDELLALPGVLHVGEETSSDTQYIDVRYVNLPSRVGRLFIPLKVYRDRRRPPGGTYVPQIAADASSLDAASLDALTRSQ